MNMDILELNDELIEKYNVEDFLFKMIKISYQMNYVPEYHYDIMDLDKYYINPKKSTFFITIDRDTNRLVATAAIRGYDKDYHIRNKHYTHENTASIYRVFVDPEYRRCKIATKMIEKIENLCLEEGYKEIYLHTQKDSCGALPFWLKNQYVITQKVPNELGTVHMEKTLCSK